MVAGLVLAAGMGKRFRSKKPKVLQTLLGNPMAWYVCKALKGVVDRLFMVVGFEKDAVVENFSHMVDQFVYQEVPLGTGHAVMCAISFLIEAGFDKCLVANGDMPLVTEDIFDRLVKQCVESDVDVGIVTAYMKDPGGYGRVLRDDKGNIKAVVEEKDIISDEVREIKEVNAGIYFLKISKVKDILNELSNENAQNEYYLTDVVDIAYKKGFVVKGVIVDDEYVVLGANNPKELVYCEEKLQKRINESLFERGVILRNFSLIKVGPEVEIDSGVELVGPLEIYGKTKVKKGTLVESHVVIKDCEIGENCVIRSFSYLEGGILKDGCEIGPFSRIRPGTVLDENVRIGNFVEVKKSHLGRGVKANHLAYLGDATVGEGSNIGAGTITCNYDGIKKHPTLIGKKAFIGSNTSLVAPVKIGDNTVVGAGSTITKDVPDGMLAVTRARQKVVKYIKINKEKND